MRIPLRETDRQIFKPTPWGSPSWQSGDNRGSPLERINSRIERVYNMERHFICGRTKMAMALGHVRGGRTEMISSLVRGPCPKAARGPYPDSRDCAPDQTPDDAACPGFRPCLSNVPKTMPGGAGRRNPGENGPVFVRGS